MKIVKSLHSSLLHRTYTYRRKFYFTVSLLWGFRLDSGEPVLEQGLWEAIGGVLGKNELFDAGMPKQNAEALVCGSYIAPGRNKVLAGRVSFAIGAIIKQLAVFGDRRWEKTFGQSWRIAGPEPFVEMPATYANGFGGEGYEKNPTGKGMVPIDTGEGMIRPLPNIEYVGRLVGKPDDRPEPAGFDRVDIMWQQRLSKAGTYDEAYIRTQMPGLPDDIDWTYFNDAARDQWVEGFFNGDERFTIENMNALHPVLNGNLPGVYGRCFVNRDIGGRQVFEEIRTRLDTVWFFPNELLGVLIHRGTVEVREDDASDIAKLLISHENMFDRPRSNAFYEKEMIDRTDPKTSAGKTLNTAPLIPQGCRCPFKRPGGEDDKGTDGLVGQNLSAYADRKINEAKADFHGRITEAGDEIKAAGIEPPSISGPLDAAQRDLSPDEQAINELLEQAIPGISGQSDDIDLAQMDLQKLDQVGKYAENLANENKKKVEAQLKDQLQELKTAETQTAETQKAVSQIEAALSKDKEPPVLPRVDADEIIASARQQIEEAQGQSHILLSMGMSPDQLTPILGIDMDDLETRLKGAVDNAKDGYRLGAHRIARATSPHKGREAQVAGALITAHNKGGRTDKGDYAFVDLSGQDLSGIDLSHAYLEYANLSDANLSGANLSHAILAHADLTGTDFSNSDLSGANIGAAKIIGTRFVDADLTGAILGKATIRKAVFHRCKMTECMELFLDAELEDVDFSGSVLRGNNFIDVDLSGCCFNETDFSKSNLINPILENSFFNNATLDGATLIKAQADNSSFENASMKNVRFMGGGTFCDAIFSGADIRKSNLRDCRLLKADFSEACLQQSDFANSNLTGARLIRASARKAQFNKADLSYAVLQRIDLMEGSLHKAILIGALFWEANLYGVDFIGCTLEDTDFTEAYF